MFDLEDFISLECLCVSLCNKILLLFFFNYCESGWSVHVAPHLIMLPPCSWHNPFIWTKHATWRPSGHEAKLAHWLNVSKVMSFELRICSSSAAKSTCFVWKLDSTTYSWMCIVCLCDAPQHTSSVRFALRVVNLGCEILWGRWPGKVKSSVDEVRG